MQSYPQPPLSATRSTFLPSYTSSIQSTLNNQQTSTKPTYSDKELAVAQALLETHQKAVADFQREEEEEEQRQVAAATLLEFNQKTCVSSLQGLRRLPSEAPQGEEKVRADTKSSEVPSLKDFNASHQEREITNTTDEGANDGDDEMSETAQAEILLNAAEPGCTKPREQSADSVDSEMTEIIEGGFRRPEDTVQQPIARKPAKDSDTESQDSEMTEILDEECFPRPGDTAAQPLAIDGSFDSDSDSDSDLTEIVTSVLTPPTSPANVHGESVIPAPSAPRHPPYTANWWISSPSEEGGMDDDDGGEGQMEQVEWLSRMKMKQEEEEMEEMMDEQDMVFALEAPIEVLSDEDDGEYGGGGSDKGKKKGNGKGKGKRVKLEDEEKE